MADGGGTIGRDASGRVRVRKPRANGWTEARRQTFLDELAATCNVTAAAATVGIDGTNAYALRRRDPAFAEAWAAAIEAGYERIELMLMERARSVLKAHGAGGDPAALDAKTAQMDTALALDVLKMRGAEAKRSQARRVGGRVRVADKAELTRKLMRLIAGARRREAARTEKPHGKTGR